MWKIYKVVQRRNDQEKSRPFWIPRVPWLQVRTSHACPPIRDTHVPWDLQSHGEKCLTQNVVLGFVLFSFWGEIHIVLPIQKEQFCGTYSNYKTARPPRSSSKTCSPFFAHFLTFGLQWQELFILQLTGRRIVNGKGNDNPLQYSCLESPMDGGAW